jgi:hypothetical protein
MARSATWCRSANDRPKQKIGLFQATGKVTPLFGSKNSQIATLVERATKKNPRLRNTGGTISSIRCIDRLNPPTKADVHSRVPK